MSRLVSIKVEDTYIHIEDDYICLTDMVKTNSGNRTRAADVIKSWLNNQSTLAFLRAWEQINNPKFKVVESHHFSLQGEGQYVSVSSWVERTAAIGIYSRIGTKGGTFAHRDIAFEFGTAISPTFKLHLIREYQRLKDAENNPQNIEWQLRRMLAKTLYIVQTDAVKQYKIPRMGLNVSKIQFAYAEEGDILNQAVFGFSAKQWREAHPQLDAKGENVRHYACTNELTILATLEGMNAQMIKEDIPYNTRLAKLKEIKDEQLKSLNAKNPNAGLRKNINGEMRDLIAPGLFPIKSITA